MKIYFSLPKMSDLLKHDSTLIKIVSVGVTAFILLSSVTVFAGFALHFDLVEWKDLAIYGSFIYPLFSLAPDLINLACFTWMVRTLLKWKDLDQDPTTTVILMIFCAGIVALTTWYSFNLSQVSSIQVAQWMRPKTTVSAQLDSTLLNQTGNILNLDSLNITGRADALDMERKATTRGYSNQIRSLVSDSLYWEGYKSDDNHQWVDRRKLDGIKDDLRRLRYERDSTIQRIASEYKTATGTSAILKDSITALLLTDTKDALIRKQDEQADQDNRHDFITRLVSTIAGYAVLILLALGAVREILFYRNGITPAPVVGPFDFQNFQHIREVMFLPFAIAGRYLINAVRQRYKSLPDLEDPAVDSFAYDYDIKTKVYKIKTNDRPGKIRAETDQDQQAKQDKPFLQRLKERKRSDQVATTGGSAANNPPVNNGNIKTEKSKNIRQCINCQKDYQIRSFNQKFCTTDCKDEYHAKKHDGQTFNPKLYRKSQKRK